MQSIISKLLTTDFPPAAPGDEQYTRGSHPAIHELAAYAEGTSEGVDRTVITGHLAKCPRCARSVEMLAGVADDAESMLENMTEDDFALAAKLPPDCLPGFDFTTKKPFPFRVTFEGEPTLAGSTVTLHLTISADQPGHNSRGVLIRLFSIGEEREFLTEAVPVELGVGGDISFTALYPEAIQPILEKRFGILITCSTDADTVN